MLVKMVKVRYSRFKEGESKMVEMIVRENRGEGRNINRAAKPVRVEHHSREIALQYAKLAKDNGFVVQIVDPHDGAILYDSETE